MSGFFHIYSLLTPSTELGVSCDVNVEMPPEQGDLNQHYTVQLDNGQYVAGTFVEPSTMQNLSICTLKLIIDGTGSAGLMHDFFNRTTSFYLKCDYLDLFLEGETGVKHRVKKRDFQIDGRSSPHVWNATLVVEKDD